MYLGIESDGVSVSHGSTYIIRLLSLGRRVVLGMNSCCVFARIPMTFQVVQIENDDKIDSTASHVFRLHLADRR